MLEGYIDFVKALFPCISPYIQENAKEAIRQFYISRKEFPCFNLFSEDELNQGDIIDNIPFYRTDEDGDEVLYTGRGIIISNSCDIENDAFILIAPMLPVGELGLDNSCVKNNTYYNILFFPDEKCTDHAADLSMISCFPKKIIEDRLRDRISPKIFCLNQIGYYLLISKITVHLLRPEDTVVQSLRIIE